MPTQSEKAIRFQALHHQKHAFIIPNPWDVGTTKLLTHLGFEALATTSAGDAFSRGLRDGSIGRDATLAHAAELVAATDLPVSADLENCYGDTPEIVGETIRLAATTGLVGASVEDATGRADHAIYPFELAVERVRAAAEAAHSLPYPFMLVGRAENFLHGRPDLADTIKRLQAYQEAGADVLYAPGLANKNDIATVLSAIDRPLNVVMGLQGASFTVAELSALGVARISVGSALSRAALGAFMRAAREMREHGSFKFAEDAISYRDISAIFEA
ncbi:MAG: isocitrate lyase/phosphoenolpyruvate mutase family protein [Herbaspirillum sp.]